MKVLVYTLPKIEVLKLYNSPTETVDKVTGVIQVWITDPSERLKTVVEVFINKAQAQMLWEQFNQPK